MAHRPTEADVGRWAEELAVAGQRLAHRFARSEPRQRAVGDIRGLLGDTARPNGGQVAEHLGDATPDGVPHLLAGDADAVRGDRMAYVRDHLGSPDRVLVTDETGFRKKRRSRGPGDEG